MLREHMLSDCCFDGGQDNKTSGVRPVWYSEPRYVAGRVTCYGGGCEDAAGRNLRGGHCQVPAGGSHHGPVQTPQHCGATWCSHSRKTGRCILTILVAIQTFSHTVIDIT